jgi:predicted dinucleotide-binding enzyme
MRLAIIGAGNVGGTLGTTWAQKAGHEIFFGVRNPTSDQTQAAVRRLGGRGRAGTPEQAAAFAQFIVLTTPWNTAEAAIRSMGDLNGKIILDATNPLTMGPDGLGLEIGHSIAAGEKVHGWAKGASVFKTLNTTGFGNMADPIFRGVKSVMFVAGDDAVNRRLLNWSHRSASRWWMLAHSGTPAYSKRMQCCGLNWRLSAGLAATLHLQ